MDFSGLDLAYLRAHPHQLPTLLTHQRIRETPVPGGSICAASRLTLDDGTHLFVKTHPAPPAGFFAAEAAGLRWLAEAGAVAVPEVVAALDDLLALEWVPTGSPTPAAAEAFGRELAALHRTGAPGFGAPWPGFIGELSQDNTGAPPAGSGGRPSQGQGQGEPAERERRHPAGQRVEQTPPWGSWFAAYRLAPHLRTSADREALAPPDVALVEQVLAKIEGYEDGEAPARIHGDLWPGNLLWTQGAGRGGGRGIWLVDPAAHGGHRETDLATLALFGGAPYLDRIRSAYQEAWPLAAGWQARIPLHQLHLLLVHTAQFGAGWRGAVVTAAERALRAVD